MYSFQHLSEISRLQVFVPKPFCVGRVLCRIALFLKKAGCLRNAVTVSISVYSKTYFSSLTG